MPDTFTCPRRLNSPMPEAYGGLDSDQWVSRAGLVGQPSGCSYCGSLPADQFLDAVRLGIAVEPTDKPYKFYLDLPSDDPKRLRVLSHAYGPNLTDDDGLQWKDLNRKQRKAVRDTGHPDTYKEGRYTFREEGPTVHAKFYTHHLSPEQGWEFWRLHKAGEVTWGYPGYPYVPLYLPGPSDDPPKEPS